MPIGPARMPLMDHLGELRRRLTIIVTSLFVTALVLYFATPSLINFLMAPVQEFIPPSLAGDVASGLYVSSPLGGFSIRFRVAIFAALCVCSPIVLWEILAFFLGIVFCDCVILGAAFGWMTGESDAIGTVLPDAETYIKAILGLEIAFGIAFELPLIVFYLIVFNLVPYKTFRKNWRTIYVVLLVLCAMVTPDANPITMLFMFAALLSMYEISMLVARFVLSKRIAKQKADGTWVDPDEDEDDDDDEDEDKE